MTKLIATIALALTSVFGLAACASEPLEVPSGSIIIDVRTPEEFATGHVDGAININLQAAEFTDLIGQLDPAGNYFVYCRSGNRSTQAAEYMTSVGFTNVTNLGGYQDASNKLGIPLVTN